MEEANASHFHPFIRMNDYSESLVRSYGADFASQCAQTMAGKFNALN